MVFFDSLTCEKCGNMLGYFFDDEKMYSFDNTADVLVSADGQHRFERCANHLQIACNFLVTEQDPENYCHSCRLNRTIPDLDNQAHCQQWRLLETAKRRLIYSLRRFRLPITSKSVDEVAGLCFDFLAELPEGEPVHTGHAGGVITLNIAEADAAHREKVRLDMEERYRTLLGHFRHEIGHYYWDLLVASDESQLSAFRECFGDERADYQQSLADHYENGARDDWRSGFISAYASSHPWEDWAETWAHYFHLVDSLETGYAFGLSVNPSHLSSVSSELVADFDPYEEKDLDKIVQASSVLALAVNSINRSMGQPDLYPFVIPPPVIEKLRFIHVLVKG